MRPPIEGGAVMITGASSGIGLELARQLAGAARALVLVARREDRLNDLRDELVEQNPKLEVSVQSCDLADTDATERMLAAANDDVGPIDVLINNAGFGDVCLFERSSWSKLEQMIRLNMLSLTQLTHRLLGPMLERGKGGILNVSSGFGLTYVPAAAVYAGTKHYVTCFTEVLRMECHGTGVVVSQLCPGPVATEFLDVAGNPTGQDIPGIIEISAERCAREAIAGFLRGKALIVPGLVFSLILWMGRITPRFMFRIVYSWMAGYLRKKTPPRELPATTETDEESDG